MNEFASGVYGKLFDDHTGYVYKVFYTEKKDNESGWIREIVALKNLSHPNIISPKFIGFNFTTDSNVKPKPNMYIKMKKYNQLLKLQFPLKDVDILQGLMDLFNGLAYMHSKFIMHRDIKEANLLYESDGKSDQQIGKLVICDFSLARFSINTSDIKHFNYLTPETVTSSHRAPEVFQSIRSNEIKGLRKGKIEYNEKVDVWSAGIVMFFLLTGLQLYYVIFCFEKENSDLLDFISKEERLKSVQSKISNKIKLDSKDRDKIYSELLLSSFATPFLLSLFDKYIDHKLEHIKFYKEIFNLCLEDVDQRPSAIDITTKISKYLLDNDISHLIIDRSFIETPNPKFLEIAQLLKVNNNRELDKHIYLFMNEALLRIKSKDVRGLILNKIAIIMNRYCATAGKTIKEINTMYVVAAAHITEIMFLYEDIFTAYFRSGRDAVYKYINEILLETDFLEGLF